MFYLHLGEKQMVPLRDVIALINAENPLSPDTADVVDKAEAERKLVTLTEEEKTKTLVICEKHVYRSPISSNTLYKRAMDNIWEEKNESTGK